jgi:hypothetical protein
VCGARSVVPPSFLISPFFTFCGREIIRVNNHTIQHNILLAYYILIITGIVIFIIVSIIIVIIIILLAINYVQVTLDTL